MAAGPASQQACRVLSGEDVCDRPYSRTLQRIDVKECIVASSITEEQSTSSSEEEVESDNESSEDDRDEMEEEAKSDHDQVGKTSQKVSLTSPELAQLQKRQTWLRGGHGSPDGSDTASVRSATKKPVRKAGLLEMLLLPKTTAASGRASSSKAQATTRPAARRRHTVDLSTRPETAGGAAAAKPRRSRDSHMPKNDGSRKAPTPVRSSPSTAATPASTSPAAKVECITCLDEVAKNRAALLECKHRMCHSCLKRIFTLSTTDPQLMPPRCCTENMIPLRHVDKLFNTTFKALWNRKYSEYTTKHRLYCPTRGCGKWIKPKHIERDLLTGRKKGMCKECKTKVCQKCGLKWHGGRECENDESTKRVLDLGKEEGWQRCYSCRAMVQLSEGCNHMRCRCNAEFCMVCGQKWKTCDCPWFNLPPELGIGGFLDPGQAIPLPPLDIRIGELPPPPPLLEGFEHFLNPRSNRLDGPLPFRDMRDMPLDPLNPGDIFRPPNVNRPRERRRRTMPAAPLSSREQEAADEALARRLQDQEYEVADGLGGIADLATAVRRRASRRERRRVYAVTDDDQVYQVGTNGEEHRVGQRHG